MTTLDSLSTSQLILIALCFVWSGAVRASLGFGGSVLSLPLLLLIHNDPLLYLPIIAVHLLVFSSVTVAYNHFRPHPSYARAAGEEGEQPGTVNWDYLRYSLAIMIVPKLVGVLGVITLPAELMSGVIFVIVSVYSISYMLNRPFTSHHPWLDVVFLILGGYVSGTSLIGAPLVIAVYARHVPRYQLRDTLFVLWFILVAIKMAAFISAGVDLQLRHQLWLLPAATVGHLLGLKIHQYLLSGDNTRFMRIVGSVLLAISILGVYRILV